MSTVLNFRREAEINFLLTSNREIQKFHKKFFGKKTATDVITFADDLQLDIVISLDQAAAQAIPRGITLPQETTLLMLHGLLHAKGFNDLTEKQSLEMRRQEFQILAAIL